MEGSPMVMVFDSHPIQYKAPVYRELARMRPGAAKVVYGTDCSLRGHCDPDFGQVVSWDVPLLEGYDNMILHNERGIPLWSFRSLTGRGIFTLLWRERPDAVLISQFLYEADMIVLLTAIALRIRVWIRQETQDEAFVRPAWKEAFRRLFYRVIYKFVDHAFYIGELNRTHLLRHGINPGRMSFAPYCAPDLVGTMDGVSKQRIRDETRRRLAIESHETLLLFSGKFIRKKNPRLILEAIQLFTCDELKRFKVVFVGSGILEEKLRDLAEPLHDRVIFPGFINQSEILQYYLAADIVILPSTRAGETWGLVINEALNAGCSVIITDAVGCHPEFGAWERVRVIADGDARACADAMRHLSTFDRSFDWCAARMDIYSVKAAATGLAAGVDRLASAIRRKSGSKSRCDP